MPITWQNINAPSLGEPGRTLAGAGQAINDAFTPLREQLKAYQTNEAQNYEVGKTNNTEAFMAQLTSRYKTPEALAAAQASGELEALRTSFGAQIDQARTREALDTRGGVLQQRDLTKRAYDNQVIEDTIRPQMQAALAVIQTGDKAKFDAFLNDPANAPLKAMKQGDLMARLTEFERATAEEGRKVSGEGRAVAAQAELLRNGEATRENMLAQQANARGLLGVAQQNAGTNAEQVALGRREADFRAGEKLQTRLDDLLKQRGQVGATISSEAGSASVLESISKFVADPKTRAQLADSFGKIAANPEFKNVTPAAALQALTGDLSTGGSIRNWFWNGSGDNSEAKLRDILKSPDSQAQVATRTAAKDSLDVQINELRTALYPARATPAQTTSAASTASVAGAPLTGTTVEALQAQLASGTPATGAAAVLGTPAPTPATGAQKGPASFVDFVAKNILTASGKQEIARRIDQELPNLQTRLKAELKVLDNPAVSEEVKAKLRERVSIAAQEVEMMQAFRAGNELGLPPPSEKKSLN
jgi:hypothetical protein